MRDIAYDNLLRSRRQRIHGQVARALEEHFPAVADAEPELLAQHFSHAGLPDQACGYYERAGDRAAAHSSFAEAVAHFHAGLKEAGQLTQGVDRLRRELALLLKLGSGLTILRGPQNPEVEDVYQRAYEIGQNVNDEKGLFKAAWGLWFAANIGRALGKARDRAQLLVTLAQRSTDQDMFLEALHCRWSTAFFRGDTAAAIRDTRQGLERYDPARHSWMGPVFGGHDPGVCAYGCLACVLSISGTFGAAKIYLEKALALAETLKHPHTLAHALRITSTAYQIRGDHEALLRSTQSLVELCDKYNFPPNRAHALVLSGWANAIGQDSEAGLEMMESVFLQATAIGPFFRCYAALLAEARAKFGKVSEALKVLHWALETVSEPGVGIFVPELYRLQGVCLLRLNLGHEEEARRALEMALATAKQQQATIFQLRAAMSMVEGASLIGSGDVGLRELRALCAELPEDFDAPELAKARQVLAAN